MTRTAKPLADPISAEPRPATGVYRVIGTHACVLLAALLLAACAAPPKVGPVPEFYPPPPETPRVQFLTAITNEEDIGKTRDAFREFVTGKPEPIGFIARPWDIDHEPGRLYVVDKSFRKVLIIDLEAESFSFADDGFGGPLQNPGGIFVSTDGFKYVADRDRRQIVVYDHDDRFIRTYDAGPEFQPVDVVVRGDRIYACDVDAENIRILDRATGETVGLIEPGDEDGGAFRFPSHLAIDDNGNIYVTDFLNFRVQVFDSDGRFIRTIGEPGDFPGAMPRPKGIAADRDGRLFAVDSAFELVQIFDATNGEVLMPFGKFGSLGGGTWLPAGVDVDYDNISYFDRFVDPRFAAEFLIYVANQSGPFKLNVYAFGHWQGAEPLPGVRPRRGPE